MLHGQVKRMCLLLLLGGVFFECQLGPLVGSGVEFLYFWLTNHCWERSAEVFNYNDGFIHFSYQFYQFLLPMFCSSVARYIQLLGLVCLPDGLILLPLCNVSVSGDFLYLKSTLSNIKITTPIFFWITNTLLVSVCYIIIFEV